MPLKAISTASPPSQSLPPPQPPSSPSPPLAPTTGPSRRHLFKTRVIPRTAAINQMEAALSCALVTVIGGSWPAVSSAQVEQLLITRYAVGFREVQVKRYSRVDFLLIFTSRALADQVLHMLPPLEAEFWLVLQRWRRQLGVLFKAFKCKVLLAVSNIPAHLWSTEVVQHILGSYCLVFDATP
jgi:hypothetical protein